METTLQKYLRILGRVTSKLEITLRDYQNDILQQVFEKFDENKSHTIMLPNGTGKTTLSYILAYVFLILDKKILLYAPYEQQIESWIANMKEDNITVCSSSNVCNVLKQKFDVVIVDGMFAAIDGIYDFEKRVENAETQLQEKVLPLSEGQKNLIAINTIKKIVEKNNTHLISFEFADSPAIAYYPLISGENIVYSVDSNSIYSFKEAAVKEIDSLVQKKVSVIIEENGQTSNAYKYDRYIELITDAVRKIDRKLDTIEDKIDTVGTNVGNVLEIVKDTNEKVTKLIDESKHIVDIFKEVHPEEDEKLEAFTNKIIEELCNKITLNIDELQGQRNYEYWQTHLSLILGDDAWNKMSDISKKFLISAKVFFLENLNMGDRVDYSSICLLASKAYETELSYRIFDKYQRFLLEDLRLTELPPALYKNTYNGKKLMSMHDFTLGLCPLIMGVIGNSAEKQINNMYFKKYCKSFLMPERNDRSIDCAIQQISEYTRIIKNQYRNPAAHKDAISMENAMKCLSYIIDVEKAMRNTLELFKI